MREFQAFVRSRPPESLGSEEVRGFLTDLAVRQGVAASTPNRAFNALLFFYRHVLGREFGRLDGVVRAKRRPYVPVVLSRGEVEAVLGYLEGSYRLVGLFLYGRGLRLAECLGLRVHCFNLEAKLLTAKKGSNCPFVTYFVPCSGAAARVALAREVLPFGLGRHRLEPEAPGVMRPQCRFWERQRRCWGPSPGWPSARMSSLPGRRATVRLRLRPAARLGLPKRHSIGAWTGRRGDRRIGRTPVPRLAPGRGGAL